MNRVERVMAEKKKKERKKAIVEEKFLFQVLSDLRCCRTRNNGINGGRDIRDASVPWKENASRPRVSKDLLELCWKKKKKKHSKIIL